MPMRSIVALMTLACAGLLAGNAAAQEVVKVGLILPMTGQQASTGKQIAAAARLYVQQHGATVAGKKVELIIKDDAAVPDNTKRIAQELIVNDKVSFTAGYGITPCALSVAPLSTRAKVPQIIMAAGTSISAWSSSAGTSAGMRLKPWAPSPSTRCTGWSKTEGDRS